MKRFHPEYLKPGMRNLKTAIAILLCLLLFQAFGGDPGIACIAALISMQGSVEASLIQGKHRIIGTIIGGVMGGVLINLFYFIQNPYLCILIIASGVSLLIWVCNLIGQQPCIVIGCVVYFVIVLGNTDISPWAYAFFRTSDTCIGILIAVAVNAAIPVKQKK